MKKILNTAVFFAMASFAAFAHGQCSVGSGVQFCSPSNGAATGTSTTVSAAGASNIVAMKLYVDGQDPAADTVQSASLTTSVSFGSGQHNLTVVGWDNPGNVYQSSITVNAGTSNGSSSGTCGANGTGVTVCSPGNGSSIASPVQIKAAAAAGSGIAAMKIYVDDQDSYTIQSNAINTSLGMSAGTHNVVVQAWDNSGNVYKTPVSVNVSGGSAPTPSPTPAPVPTSGPCSASGTGVSVCAPMNGANTGSPVQITAGAAAGSGIAAMKVYIDNQDSYTIQSNSINTTLPMSSGSHYVVVQAWDNSGNVYKTPVNISVNGGSASAPTSCGATSGVLFCSPTNGSAASGSVPVVAAGSSNIIAMQLYVDGQNPAAASSSSNNLSTSVSLSSGGHNLTVNGWDNAGNVYQASINVNGQGTPTSSSPNTGGSVPAPPANAIVYNNIQNQGGWQGCGGCGNNASGSGQGPSYGISEGISSPSLSGSAADFYTNGGPAYSGGYNFIEQPTVPNPVTYLRYEFDIYVPSQWANTPQALEWECQQNANGYTYNYAFQADYADGVWRVFNYNSKNWEDTGIQFSGFTPNTWHHVISMYHASGTQTVHDSITIDGVTHPVNITHQATYTGNGLEFTNAFQEDLNGNGSGYQVYVDNMKVTLAD